MSEALLNHMRRAGAEAIQDRAETRHGIVTSFDPDNWAVKAELQPDGTLTGWIPLKSQWVGNGWGMFCAPSIGDIVEIDFQEADGGVGSGGWRFFNDVNRPLPTPSGEFWLVHKLGAAIKLTNDGAAALSAGDGMVRLNADGTITSAGNWTTPLGCSGSGDSMGSLIFMEGS